jgi:peptide-methionine (S)-S-oxide reductase
MMKTTTPPIVAALARVGTILAAWSFQATSYAENPPMTSPADPQSSATTQLETATFGSGCFWCTEAVFDRLKGVKSVVSGYTGGHLKDPTYEQVCSGTTGHAEVIQVTFDPNEISYPQLLRVFWNTHDPTTLNQQGHDVGTQYRSAVFYHTDQQRNLAEYYKQQLDTSKVFKAPIVTEIVPFKTFYPAEKYHQDYFELNPSQQYCSFVIRPKVEKFEQAFGELIEDAPATVQSAKP